MTALQRTVSLALTLLAVAVGGCASCPTKTACCGEGIGCCDSIGGRGMAFQKYNDCGDCSGPPVCVCTGDCGCEATCGCEASCACEPGCAAEPGCCVEPDCCVEPGCACDDCGAACGCGDGCRPGATCLYNVKYTLGKLFGCLCGCSGCDGELYWSEWHNDPPRCCDPCDKCGNFVGPSAGAY